MSTIKDFRSALNDNSYSPGEVINCFEVERLAGFYVKSLIFPATADDGLPVSFAGVFTRLPNGDFQGPSGSSAIGWVAMGENYWYGTDPDGNPAFTRSEFLPDGGFTVFRGESTTNIEPIVEKVFFQPGQLIRVVDQGGRIERFLGGTVSDNANWLVLKNTVNIAITNLGSGYSIYINGFECGIESDTYIGWHDPATLYLDSGEGVPWNWFDWFANSDFTNYGGGVVWSAGTFNIGVPMALPPRSSLMLRLNGYF